MQWSTTVLEHIGTGPVSAVAVSGSGWTTGVAGPMVIGPDGIGAVCGIGAGAAGVSWAMAGIAKAAAAAASKIFMRLS
jgi:hypothetical protein